MSDGQGYLSDLGYNRGGRLGPAQARALGAAGVGPGDGALVALRGRVAWSEPAADVVYARSAEARADSRAPAAGAPEQAWAARGALPLLPGLDLWPGPYVLYVHAASGMVVGAEVPGAPAPHAPTEAHREAYLAVLLAAFGFDRADLEETRAGRAVPLQIGRLRSAATQAVQSALIFVFCAVLVGGFGAGFYALDGEVPGAAVALVASVLIALGMLVLAGLSFLRARVIGREAEEGRVAWVDGPVRVWMGQSRGAARYYAEVGGRTFGIGRKTASALMRGWPHRVYFFPRSGEVAFVEGWPSPPG